MFICSCNVICLDQWEVSVHVPMVTSVCDGGQGRGGAVWSGGGGAGGVATVSSPQQLTATHRMYIMCGHHPHAWWRAAASWWSGPCRLWCSPAPSPSSSDYPEAGIATGGNNKWRKDNDLRVKITFFDGKLALIFNLNLGWRNLLRLCHSCDRLSRLARWLCFICVISISLGSKFQ